MRVVYCFASFPVPSETFLRREILSLIKLGVDVKILALSEGDTSCLTEDELALKEIVKIFPGIGSSEVWRAGARWEICHPIRVFRSFMMLRRSSVDKRSWLLKAGVAMEWAAREAEKFKPDIVHSTFAGLPMLFASSIAALIKSPLTLSVHANDIITTPESSFEFICPKPKKVFCCSKYAKEKFENKVSELSEKTLFAPHGVPVFPVKEKSDNSENSKVLRIFAAGRFVEKKGFSNLINACAELENRGITISLSFAGDGILKETFVKLVSRHRLGHRVNFLGWLSQEDLRNQIESCDILVIPSVESSEGDFDGVPNILLEAFERSCPVIACSVGGITEVMNEVSDYGLIKPDDESALVSALEEFYNKPDSLISQGKLGREYVVRNRNLETCVRPLIDEWKSLLGEKNA